MATTTTTPSAKATQAPPDAGPPAAAPRVITRRRRLPSGRAVLGAALVTVAAMGTFVVASSEPPPPHSPYVVVARSLRAGDVITDTDLVVEPMMLSDELAARAFTSPAGLAGAVVLRSLPAGALLVPADIRPAGATVDPVHELTVPIPVDRSPDQLRPGDRVSLLAYDERRATTTVAAEDALVLSYRPPPEGIAGGRAARLTLGLGDAESTIRVAHLSFTELTVVLTSRALTDEYPTDFSEPVATPPPEVVP